MSLELTLTEGTIYTIHVKGKDWWDKMVLRFLRRKGEGYVFENEEYVEQMLYFTGEKRPKNVTYTVTEATSKEQRPFFYDPHTVARMNEADYDK